MHLLRSLRYGMPGGGRHSFGASADQPDEIRPGEIVLISIPLLIPTFSKGAVALTTNKTAPNVKETGRQ